MTQINVSIYVIVEEKFIYSRSDIPKRSNIMPLNIITLQNLQKINIPTTLPYISISFRIDFHE